MKSREEYIQSLHNKIDKWNMEIDRLSAQKDKVEANSRLELQKQINTLKQKRAEIKQQVDKISKSSTEAWEDLKIGIDSAWESMNEAVDSAVSRFLN